MIKTLYQSISLSHFLLIFQIESHLLPAVITELGRLHTTLAGVCLACCDTQGRLHSLPAEQQTWELLAGTNCQKGPQRIITVQEAFSGKVCSAHFVLGSSQSVPGRAPWPLWCALFTFPRLPQARMPGGLADLCSWGRFGFVCTPLCCQHSLVKFRYPVLGEGVTWSFYVFIP